MAGAPCGVDGREGSGGDEEVAEETLDSGMSPEER